MTLVKTETCEMCGRKEGECHVNTVPRPSMEELEHYQFDGICEATDGCVVEPDGHCEHGHASWFLVLGLI